MGNITVSCDAERKELPHSIYSEPDGRVKRGYPELLLKAGVPITMKARATSLSRKIR